MSASINEGVCPRSIHSAASYHLRVAAMFSRMVSLTVEGAMPSGAPSGGELVFPPAVLAQDLISAIVAPHFRGDKMDKEIVRAELTSSFVLTSTVAFMVSIVYYGAEETLFHITIFSGVWMLVFAAFLGWRKLKG